MSDERFIYSEDLLAKALGLPEKLLQKTRAKKMSHGPDWDLVKGRVAYSRAGTSSLLFLLENSLSQGTPLEALLEKCRLPAAGDTPTIAATIKRFWPNPHLVDVTTTGENTIRIYVKTTKTLRVGMTLRLIPRDGGYELAQRLPRTVRQGRREHAS